jgi:hypothetical protein
MRGSKLNVLPRMFIALLLSGVVLTGCGAPRLGSTGFSREVESLRSTENGLYYPPYLRGEPAGVADNYYALKIEKLLGQHVELRLDAKSIGFLRTEALNANEFVGGSWLSEL